MAPRADTATLFTPAPLPVAVLNDEERLACLRLIRSENVGPVAFRELINHFGGAARALDALPRMARRANRGRTIRICPRDDAEAELEAARRTGATPIFTIEPGYPAHMAVIDAPPPLLYVKGRAELLNKPAIGIVGSRQASAAGIRLARMFASDLAALGFVIVSGLARGIDGAAHEASLATGTIAVIAGGPDNVYPPEHAALQSRIAEDGALITEQPPGFIPRAKDFPRRNRLISAQSLGVIVVEAAKRSGTLVTARFAAEQGREVFAVPGHPLDPRAEGTNDLIKQGAILATSAQDVSDVVRPMLARPQAFDDEPTPQPRDAASTPRDTRPPDELSEEAARAVLDVLGPHPVDLDEIARATGLPIRDVRVALLELDLQGLIERHGHHLVSRLT